MIAPLTSWSLGLDLGQRHGHSALATLSLDWTVQGQDPVDYHWIRVPRLVLRDIERFGCGYFGTTSKLLEIRQLE